MCYMLLLVTVTTVRYSMNCYLTLYAKDSETRLKMIINFLRNFRLVVSVVIGRPEKSRRSVEIERGPRHSLVLRLLLLM